MGHVAGEWHRVPRGNRVAHEGFRVIHKNFIELGLLEFLLLGGNQRKGQ